MTKFFRVVSCLLIPCLVADPALASNLLSLTGMVSDRHTTAEFSISAIIPEPAMSEGKIMYSLGQAGSTTGYRHQTSFGWINRRQFFKVGVGGLATAGVAGARWARTAALALWIGVGLFGNLARAALPVGIT